jgi:hypothetical protein
VPHLRRQGSGTIVNVVLVEPSSTNTPLFDHARTRVGRRPRPIPPVYQPSAVAEAIVSAGERPVRKVVVGGAGKLLTLGQRIDPRLVDLYMLLGDRMVKDQRTDEPPEGRDNLFEPVEGPGATTGRFGDGARRSSLYTRHVEQRALPVKALLVLVVAGSLALRARVRS